MTDVPTQTELLQLLEKVRKEHGNTPQGGRRLLEAIQGKYGDLPAARAAVALHPAPGKSCGSCALCCKLVPVDDPNLKTPAGKWCPHAKPGSEHGACTIYETRPLGCATWACMWLVDPDLATSDMPRPDKAHYVLDMLPDHVRLRNDESGQTQEIMVMQVWIDPAYPGVERDPKLLAWIEHIGKTRQMAALLRWGNKRGLFICPPSLASDKKWHHMESPPSTEHGVGLWNKNNPVSRRMPGEE